MYDIYIDLLLKHEPRQVLTANPVTPEASMLVVALIVSTAVATVCVATIINDDPCIVIIGGALLIQSAMLVHKECHTAVSLVILLATQLCIATAWMWWRT